MTAYRDEDDNGAYDPGEGIVDGFTLGEDAEPGRAPSFKASNPNPVTPGPPSQTVRRLGMAGVAAILTLATLALLAPGAPAQTQPAVTVANAHPDQPLVPLEETPVEVTAQVSCDGWGQLGADTVAIFQVQELPQAYKTRWDPQEVSLPATPAQCEPGEPLNATTTLWVQPTRQAPAFASYERPLLVTLEERIADQPTRTWGPYDATITLQTGFLPSYTLTLDPATQGPAGSRLNAQLNVENHANGDARLNLEATTRTDATSVRLEPSQAFVRPGETATVDVIVHDERRLPLSPHEDRVDIDGTLGPGIADPAPDTLSSVSETVTVSYEASGAALTDAAPYALIALLIAGLAAVTVATRDRRGAPSTAGAPVRRHARAVRSSIGSMSERARSLTRDQVGAALLWSALLVAAVAATQQDQPLTIFFAFAVGVAGSVLLLRAWLPAWAGALAIGGVFVLVAVFMIEFGVTIAIGGRPLTWLEASIPNLTLITFGPPYAFSVAALVARTRSWGRLSALASPALLGLLFAGVSDWLPSEVGLFLLMGPLAVSLAWFTLEITHRSSP